MRTGLTPALSCWLLMTPLVFAGETQPYAGGPFQGRIAWSCDGNHNDPDDWAASPVALAIFAEAGLRDRLIHFDYNSILPETNEQWERTHAESVLEAAERYGYDKSHFHDCRKNLQAAVASIARAIDASSATNPLYFIIAGPMEVPCRGIQQSDPARRKHVFCISHSRWNDGFARGYSFTHTKRSVIEQAVNWVQIPDQNRLLSLSPYGRPAKPEQFAGFFWMRDSRDVNVRFLWERMLVSTRPDPSDAGMAWFLATGDEDCDPAKLKHLLDDHQRPAPVTARKQIRVEAENFRQLDNFKIEDRNDRNASQHLQVVLGESSGSIRTRFNEPYAPAGGQFTVDVRHQVESGAKSRFAFLVNGIACGGPWESLDGQSPGWTSQVIRDVAIRAGDELRVEVTGARGRLDYVQLNLQDATSAAKDNPSYFPPPESKGGWRALVRVNETPTAGQKAAIRAKAGLDWDKLAEAQKYGASFNGPSSLLVIRHGWIAGEWSNMSAPRGIASCTKSLTALAMAKLFDLNDAGRLTNSIAIEDEAWRFLPPQWAEAEPARKQIQLRHLLTMTSGLTPYDGPYPTNTYRDAIFAQTVEAPPGKVWAYASVPVDMLSLIIENVTGRTEDEFFHAEIGARIGGAPMKWGRFGGHTGGSGGPEGGARFTARELARVGYLALRDGTWEGDGRRQQVISAKRLREFTRQADFLETAAWRQPNFAREPNSNQSYSHLWWNNGTGQTLGESVPRDTFYMSGWGKQTCAIVPSLDLVVVRLGANRVLNDHPEYYRELWSRLMAAVVVN